MQFHGYGGSELGANGLKRWTDQGYAAFSMSDRGFGPCGAKPTPPARCADGGWVRLMDTRYEVRDAQLFAGMLVDEGIAAKGKIASAGGSYGGGLSMALAALKNRTMMRGRLARPLEEPGRDPHQPRRGDPRDSVDRPRQLTAAERPHARLPRGRALPRPRRRRADRRHEADLRLGPLRLGRSRRPLRAAARRSRRRPRDMVRPDQRRRALRRPSAAGHRRRGHHAPLLVLHRSLDPPGAAPDLERLDGRHLPGRRGDPLLQPHPLRVPRTPTSPSSSSTTGTSAARTRTRTSTCSRTIRTPSSPITSTGEKKPQGGVTTLPRRAARTSRPPARSGARPGQRSLRARSVARVQARADHRADGAGMTPSAARPTTRSRAAAPARPPPGSDQSGAASYRLDPAPAGGYTLMGSPTVVAKITSSGPTSQVASRLLDVDPDGDATLVARGSYRPDAEGKQVFQLHPNGYEFAEGHVAKLELLPVDAPYGRPRTGRPRSPSRSSSCGCPSLKRDGELDGLCAGRPARSCPTVTNWLAATSADSAFVDGSDPLDCRPPAGRGL